MATPKSIVARHVPAVDWSSRRPWSVAGLAASPACASTRGLEVRRALLQEGLNALAVLRSEIGVTAQTVEPLIGAWTDCYRVAQLMYRLLGRRDRRRGTRRDRPGHGVGALLQLVPGDHFVDKSRALCRFRRDRIRGEEHLLHDPKRSAAHEVQEAIRVVRKSELCGCDCERARLIGEDDVARHHEVE